MSQSLNPREQSAQDYVDALSDPQCFCKGHLFSFRIMPANEPITNEPNCAVRHNCRLFNRTPKFGKPFKIWAPHAWGDVCLGRWAWDSEQEFERHQEELDSMKWIVTIGDRQWEVSKQTAQMAVMLCLVQLRREGMPDEEVRHILSNNLYQVSEV